jgi:hypothetical protein
MAYSIDKNMSQIVTLYAIPELTRVVIKIVVAAISNENVILSVPEER